MKALLVRVAADQSDGGGNWNGPCDEKSREFVYVAIPEGERIRPGHKKPYLALSSLLARFSTRIPQSLRRWGMHLDPDFEHLTYGDTRERAKQIRSKLTAGDLIVFYSGLRDVESSRLIYALTGLYEIEEIVDASSVPGSRCHENAHTRRFLPAKCTDIVVRARPGKSGRLDRLIPIGSYRQRAYRVYPKLLKEWGGLTVKNGYLQRSARLPEFRAPERFYEWFKKQRVRLLRRNN